MFLAMFNYHTVFSSPCKLDHEESDEGYSDLLTKFWKQLVLQFTETRSSCGTSKNFFRPLNLSDKEISESMNSETIFYQNGWFDLDEYKHNDLFLNNIIKDFSMNWHELGIEEMIAEQLHKIADLMTDKFYILNIYWLTCGHAQCIESSDNIAIHGALKRLQKCNMASITYICNSDILCKDDFTDIWFTTQTIYVASEDEKIIQDNDIIWKGCLHCLENNENEENDNWNLSRMLCQESQSSGTSYSKNKEMPLQIQDHQVLAEDIEVICELRKNAIPFWKIFPSQFLLYHNSLMKRVFELQDRSEFEIPSKDVLLLASIGICDKKNERRNQVKTVQDWMELIMNQSEYVETIVTRQYLALYPVEPGIFLVYFIRSEDDFINLRSLLAVYQAIFSCTETETSCIYDDKLERRWLQLLDTIHSKQKSPLKSEFSLAVHLDASEMLKHFTKDGKPLKKELKALLNQMEERGNISPGKKAEIQKRHEMAAGVDYCLHNIPDENSSLKLLPKHETLSICNTPKTLAKAKSHDLKRKTIKNESLNTELVHKIRDKPELLTEGQVEQSKKKKSRSGNTKTSLNKHNNKELQPKQDTSEDETKQSKKKRRSFDGGETVKETAGTNEKEKRSDRHKRRLARVVKRALIKHGVNSSDEYFKTCSERLYYLCKSFLKDLKTSEGLNNEMKRLAESNVATVVEFEKRQYTSKVSEKQEKASTSIS